MSARIDEFRRLHESGCFVIPNPWDAGSARLLERSYRTEAARRRHPTGTGLGLSIAKEVCEKHGFRFELRRADVGGLEAILRGPRAAARDSAPDATPPADAAAP